MNWGCKHPAISVWRSWLVLKRVPEYRFDAELQNVQECISQISGLLGYPTKMQ